MRESAPVWKFAEINPLTPEFKDTPEGTEVAFMPLEAVWPGGRADSSQRIPWSSKQSYTQFRRGDILIPKITPTFEAGRTIIAEIPTWLGLASTEVHVARVRPNADARYLQYCFQSRPFLDEGAHSLQGVGNLRRITPRFVQEHRVLDASRSDQRSIADYLDRETGEIDAMLGKLDELAETLEARRRSAVDRAFFQAFKGPTMPVQMIADVTVGIVIEPAKLYVPYGQGVPALRGLNVAPGQILNENIVHISRDGHAAHLKSELRAGDVVTVRTGRVGTTSVVTDEWDGANAIDLVITRLRDGHDSKFFYWYLLTSIARDQIDNESVGSVQSHFNVGALKRLRVPKLDEDEQKRIADHLDEVTGKIDAMLAKVAELRSLLLEHRSALITDVVTGRKEIA